MAWLFYLSSGAQRSMNGTGLGLTCFWAPSLEQGVNVPSSSRARRSSQSGSLPREGHGHSVLPEGATSQEEHVGLQPCDRAAAQVTADMASRRICAVASPWVGRRAGQQRAAPRNSLASSRCILLPSGWERLKSQLPLTSLPLLVVPGGPV